LTNFVNKQSSAKQAMVTDIAKSLPTLPVELATSIICSRTSFREVLALSSTCHQLRDVWLQNVTVIYSHVAPRSIPCLLHARVFLADQGGPSPNAAITSSGYVVAIMRNAHIIEEAILQFETQIVSRVRLGGNNAEEYYGVGATRHPLHLTRTERNRFIRSYYVLWGLMRLRRPLEWQARINAMTLKELFLLCEISRLPDSIGRGEEVIPPPLYPGADPQSYDAINRGRSPERDALEKLILSHLETTYTRTHGRAMDGIWVYAMEEGFLGRLSFLFYGTIGSLLSRKLVSNKTNIEPFEMRHEVYTYEAGKLILKKFLKNEHERLSTSPGGRSVEVYREEMKKIATKTADWTEELVDINIEAGEITATALEINSTVHHNYGRHGWDIPLSEFTPSDIQVRTPSSSTFATLLETLVTEGCRTYKLTQSPTEVQAAFSVLTDFYILILPIPVIMGMQMTLWRKLGILGIFMTGLL
ncbi:MAG: hypothetical protein Q9218_004099, partial [Villophora microphyllina]